MKLHRTGLVSVGVAMGIFAARAWLRTFSNRTRLVYLEDHEFIPVGALVTEQDFEDLAKHLDEVRPIINAFSQRHDFALVDPRSTGRYPRIRIARGDSPQIWFDLTMALDENVRRYEQFERSLPYELSCGARLYVEETSGQWIRLSKVFVCFDGRPFEEVPSTLEAEMKHSLPMLETWDAEYLMANGERMALDRAP